MFRASTLYVFLVVPFLQMLTPGCQTMANLHVYETRWHGVTPKSFRKTSSNWNRWKSQTLQNLIVGVNFEMVPVWICIDLNCFLVFTYSTLGKMLVFSCLRKSCKTFGPRLYLLLCINELTSISTETCFCVCCSLICQTQTSIKGKTDEESVFVANVKIFDSVTSAIIFMALFWHPGFSFTSEQTPSQMMWVPFGLTPQSGRCRGDTAAELSKTFFIFLTLNSWKMPNHANTKRGVAKWWCFPFFPPVTCPPASRIVQ